ncbi:MAG: ABC transporter ATP-binding protein [Candidatus Njordarchaeia archaeon]
MIELVNVSRVYKMGKTKILALKNVNLYVEKGEIISIMGASGSGKSTLLHIIGALDKPTSGKVLIEGVNIVDKSEKDLAKFRRKNVGFVFQFFYLAPTLTALENVMLPLLPINPPWLRERAYELLKAVGLADRVNHKPSELSGGEQQRVAIARALINDPKIILADEPTGNLDSKTGLRIIKLLRNLARKYDKTLIIATHNKEVANMTDRIIHLRDGEIVGEEKNASSVG